MLFRSGFLVLSDVAHFHYKCTDFYHPGDEGGIKWNDPDIGIVWPDQIAIPRLSDKDSNAMAFRDLRLEV